MFSFFGGSKKEEKSKDSKSENNSVGASSPVSFVSESTVSTEVYSPRNQTNVVKKSDSEIHNSSFSPTSKPDFAEVVDTLNDVDYDEKPTKLYTLIQNKQWEDAAACAEKNPKQIRTWVYRTEEDKTKLRWRLLPIHAVCIFKSPEFLVELLLDEYAYGATLTDDQGMLPIHLACRNGATRGVVRMLLESYPESLEMTDRKNRTPMQLAERSTSYNKESVLSLLRRAGKQTETPRSNIDLESKGSNTKSVSSAKEVSYEQRTYLLKSIMRKDWGKAARRCRDHPEEAGTWIATKGKRGVLRFLPIHKVCVMNPPEELVEALLDAYPDGAKSVDQEGWLPIHCAAFYGASPGVIEALLGAYPEGARTADSEQKLPLHYACLKEGSAAAVQPLLDEFPKGAQHKDDEGRLPLHLVCNAGAPKLLVESVWEVYPQAAEKADGLGRIPLHHACFDEVDEVVVKFLIDVFSRGPKVKDDQGKLPMHYACENPHGKEAISLLMAAYPQAVTVKDSLGYTPLMSAKAVASGSVEWGDSPMSRNSGRADARSDTETRGGDGFRDNVAVLSPVNNNVEMKLDQYGVKQNGSSGSEKELMARIAALEMTVQGFTKATKDMRESLREGQNPEEVLSSFAARVDSQNVVL